MRGFDWPATALGPVTAWPGALRTIVSVMLRHRQPMAVWWGDTCVHLYNDAFRSILGDKHPAALGQSGAAVWVDSWDSIGAMIRTVLASGSASSTEHLLDHQEQSCITLSYSPVPDDYGSNGGVLVTAAIDRPADLAAHLELQRLRRETQAALRASEEKFAAAFELSPLALTITSVADGRLVEVNEGFLRLSGYSREETLGRTIDELQLWIEPEKRAAGLAQLRSGQRIFGSEARFRTKSGDETVGLIGSTVIHLGGKPHVLSSIADVTALKRTEEQLRQRSAEAESLLQTLKDTDRRKDEFLAMLGHELRNPLAAIRNAVAIASLDAARQPRALEIARRQTEQLGRLIDDLLDVARITQGRISLHKETAGLGDIVARAVESTRPFIESRGLTLTVAQPLQPIVVEADPARLEQVFVNLLSNAGKYTDEGGQVHVRLERRGDMAAVCVRDTGIGMAPETIARMWDLFAQADRTLDRSQGGLGIGLTVARRLVELHGGHIEAHSEGVGEGTELVVLLPSLAASHQGGDDRPVLAGHAATARVLLIEDNLDAAESLQMLLEMLGHQVRVAHDGLAGLQAAAADPPQVMIVDIGLPGIDGYEVARRVRQDARLDGVRLIALTGYGREEDREKAIAAGFDRHLVKPIDPQALEALVEPVNPA